MRKLNRLILTIVLLASFLIMLQVGSTKQVKAQDPVPSCTETGIQCDVWVCEEIVCSDTGVSIYNTEPGCYSDCTCTYTDYFIGDVVNCSDSCDPGYYVCNREGGCCPVGVVDPTPWPDGSPGTGGNTCGDGTCAASEDNVSCPSDCSSACGDGSCNYGETCSSCEADCGTCPVGEFCGDGLCGADEACNTCVTDCGVCPFCGNFECAGFETCASCENDCGICPTNFAWWQVRGGNFASEADYGYSIRSIIPSDTVCIEPSCYPYLTAVDTAGVTNSDGFPLIAGGEVSANGQISSRTTDVYAGSTTRTRLRETYSHFYSQFSLGFSPTDDYTGSADDALEPSVSQDYYFHSGNMTIQSPWSVTSGESYVVFVDGDLSIQDPGAVGELITVDEGGFLAFVVSGDINIADSVGHSVLTNTTGNIEGVYVADGTITTMSNGGLDKKFVGEGTFAGWTDVVLLRDFDGGADNDLYPAETFVYRPDLVKNTPEQMKRAQMLWQETN